MYDLSAATRPGSPVFLPDGRLLGVTVSFSGGEGLASLTCAGDAGPAHPEIAKLADQARKAAEKKPKDKK